MTDTTQATWLTQEVHDRLTAELAHLSGPGREEVAARIEAAREEGDLKENGGYHAAREEQGKQELRIRELEQLLRNAVVGEAAKDVDTITGGVVVTTKIFGETEKFLLGSREVAESTDLEVCSEKSPMGEALLGRKAGESVSYVAPNGTTIEVEILAIEPYVG